IIAVIEPGPDYVLGNPSAATISISNDDDADLPAVGFLLSESSGREDSAIAALAVRITANPKTNQDPAKVDFRVTAGNAIKGINYRFAPPFTNGTGTLTFVHVSHSVDPF